MQAKKMRDNRITKPMNLVGFIVNISFNENHYDYSYQHFKVIVVF